MDGGKLDTAMIGKGEGALIAQKPSLNTEDPSSKALGNKVSSES
jgi:hypothetical protein